ncbi:DUF2167 domain-containing protein [Nemorincola caseinilytica]|uniref:DUF2167 domain-containing protein n=2 Tax=Nemorincola caseinilytica TaxID=2054315 RepID=A0ABP8NCR0_9BACT
MMLLLAGTTQAQKAIDDAAVDSSMLQEMMVRTILDSIDKTIAYQYGKVPVKDIAELNLPAGYKYIPADKAQMILHDLWGNPERDDVLGMVVKNDYKVSELGAWAFIVSYDEDGYVKDEDADKINYDDLLKEIQESEIEINKERVKEGYPEIHLLDWAAKPYYDKDNKVLHWAKKLKFTGEEQLTLNYDVRILGRKGILSMNAVGTIDQLADINTHIPSIVKMAVFTDGNKYKDFNPSVDKVAAYTIGGLIAGKLIAKTGLLVLLLKNIKLILLAVFGGFAAFRKKLGGLFSRKKKEEEAPAYEPAPAEAVAIQEHTEPHTPDSNNNS